MRIHLVRHFPAVKDPEVEKALGTVEGGRRRPLDFEKAVRLAPKLREKLSLEQPAIRIIGCSPTVRTHATMMIATVGMINPTIPFVQIPELYWTDESIAGIMADFKAHDVDCSRWSPEGLEALDRLGKQGAEGIRRVLMENNITEGDALFVGHGPLTAAIAYQLASTEEARKFCLSRFANEGSRFVVDGERVAFVMLE